MGWLQQGLTSKDPELMLVTNNLEIYKNLMNIKHNSLKIKAQLFKRIRKIIKVKLLNKNRSKLKR